MKSLKAMSLVSVLAISGSACDQPREAFDDSTEGVEAKQLPILSGTTTSVPWVGLLLDHTDSGFAGQCTASLINERVVLTASHCVRGWDGLANQYEFQREGSQERVPVRSIVNLGPNAGRHLSASELDSWFLRNLAVTPDGRGNNDVALVALERPIFLPRYAPVSPSFPSAGQTVTTAGYGCTENVTQSGSGVLRSKSWLYSGERSFERSAALCPGDSGGPAWIGASDDADKSIWGVNSTGGGTFDTFGNTVLFWPQIRSTAETLRDQLKQSSFPILKSRIEGGSKIAQGEFRKGPDNEFVITGQETLTVSLTNVTGDPDLYVKRDGVVTTDSYDCRPYFGTAQSESCVFFQPGSYTVAVRGYHDASYDLRAYLAKTGVNPVVAGQRFDFPDAVNVGGGEVLTVTTGGNGNADLFVRRGVPPTDTEFDCKSSNADSRERCTLSGAGAYYVAVRAQIASSAVSLFVQQQH